LVQASLRRIRVGLVACAAATAGVLTAAALASTPPAKKCRPGSAAAACLKVGQACAAKKGAAYRKAGFHCVAGRLRKLAPSKTTTARPPATTTTAETTTTTEAPSLPPAGHYAGTTGQGHSIAFDVRADGKNLTNIVGGAVDETCTPSRTWTFPGFETGGFDYPVSSAGTFHLNGGSRNTDAGISSSTKITMSASWDGGQAQGTYAVTSTFTDQGTSYACAGSVAWTAALS